MACAVVADVLSVASSRGEWAQGRGDGCGYGVVDLAGELVDRLRQLGCAVVEFVVLAGEVLRRARHWGDGGRETVV
jgi:hypothetical protein